jgi:hemolysin activation/secretion protein
VLTITTLGFDTLIMDMDTSLTLPKLVFFLLISLFCFTNLLSSSPLHAQEFADQKPDSPLEKNHKKYNLMQVSKFTIKRIGSSKGNTIDSEKINIIIEESLEEFKNGYDIDALTTLTDAITDFYRKEGYFLAQAFIPEQNIQNNEVIINVIEGHITDVIAENNILYSDETLTKTLQPALGLAAHKDTIESAMLHLNDYPGVKTNAIFSPGEELGTALITINTKEEKAYQGSINFDNFGNEFTGDYRLRGRLIANNLADLADRLQLDLLQTVSPANSTYWAVNYSVPILMNGLSTGIALSNNAYVVGDIFTDLDLDGSSQLIDIFGRYNFQRSRVTNLYTRFGLSLKSAESGGGGNQLETSDDLTVFYATIGFDGDDPLFVGRHSGELILSQGLTDNTNDDSLSPVTDGQFTKLNANYSHSLPLENNNNQFLIASMRMQYSNNILNSLEQLPLGGPYNVRAYSVSKYLVDSGFIFNFEWLIRTLPSEDLSWTKNVQLSSYFDFAFGTLNKNNENSRTLTDDGSSVSLKGLGFGIQLTPSIGYQLRFDLAFPLGKPEPTDDSGMQFLINLGYQF